jgi:hypothetical protein
MGNMDGVRQSAGQWECSKCRRIYKISFVQWSMSDSHTTAAICECGEVACERDRMRDYTMTLLSSPPARLEGGATDA